MRLIAPPCQWEMHRLADENLPSRLFTVRTLLMCAGQLGSAIKISRDKTKVTVTSNIAVSKRRVPSWRRSRPPLALINEDKCMKRFWYVACIFCCLAGRILQQPPCCHGASSRSPLPPGKKKTAETETSCSIGCSYLKYLTKKYLKKYNVRDWLRVIASNKDRKCVCRLARQLAETFCFMEPRSYFHSAAE